MWPGVFGLVTGARPHKSNHEYFNATPGRKAYESERDFVAPIREMVRHARSSVVLPRLAGIHFRILGKHSRAMYQQLDGSWELADACSCLTLWEDEFRVERVADCPIDEHKIAANRLRGKDEW